jgi:hypothetical protein
MPDAATDSARTSERIKDIPLYLIPKTIADQIRKKRESVFQITVERRLYHRYTVIVETYDEHVQRVNQEALARSEGDGHG